MLPISTAIIRHRFSISLIVFTLLCSLSVPAKEPSLDNDSTPYGLPKIELAQNSFTVNNEPFRFIGANAVNLVFYDDFDLDINEAIKTAKENGIDVIRLFMDWGWGKPEDYDRILNVASNHGVYVILTFTDFRSYGEELKQERHYSKHAIYRDFFNAKTLGEFKSWIKKIINRQNSLNGKRYRDDTTIFAWDIGNEPEYQRYDYSEVRRWLQGIASYIKSLDPNHLITIGIDTSSPEFDIDGSSYDILNIPDLDFFSFHFYPIPVDWDGNFDLENYKNKIIFRTKRLLSMRKPVIMEEFDFSPSGKLNSKIKSNPGTKQLYYNVIRECMDAAFSSGASGVMFWGWGIPAARSIPMWWSIEEHNAEDKEFSILVKEYKFPSPSK